LKRTNLPAKDEWIEAVKAAVGVDASEARAIQAACLSDVGTTINEASANEHFAICLLTEPVVMTQEMVANKDTIETVVKKIDTVYKQVKKNEISPKMDYLMGSAGGAKSDLDKTIEKMDKLNSMNTIIRTGV
jgi:hypothetical protein